MSEMLTILAGIVVFIGVVFLYGMGLTLVWLGLRYDNGWVIAAGIVLCLSIKTSIGTKKDKEKENE